MVEFLAFSGAKNSRNTRTSKAAPGQKPLQEKRTNKPKETVQNQGILERQYGMPETTYVQPEYQIRESSMPN